MTNQPLDPRQEQLIAALYGELSAEEEKAFFALLEADAELKREWDELNETRSFMSAAREGEEAGFEFEKTPESEGFTFDATAISGITPEQVYTQPDRRGSWLAWLDLLRTPAVGFAAVAAALVIMVLSGLRVDTVNGGMLVHFGPLPTTTATIPVGGVPGGESLVPTPMQFASSDYVTREELMNYTQNLLNLSEARLISQQDEQQKNIVRSVAGFYNEFNLQYNQNQQQTQEELAKIWFGLEGLERFSAQRLNAPVSLDNTPQVTPAILPANRETEDR
jgi:hypothetical protein